jgi:hypothetical protein
MRIGISINGVLRNYFKQIEETHEKYFPPSEVEDEEGFKELSEPIKILDYDLEKWVTFPKEKKEQVELEFNPDFDPLSSKSRDSVQDLDLESVEEEITLNEFLYERCTLEIFGAASEIVPNAVDTVNKLILDFPEHEFIMVSREGGLSVPSTLFFLSKTSCMSQEIKFVTDSRDSWKHVDVMVTDHPDVIDSTPENKACIVINKDFNQSKDTHTRIDSIKELRDVLELP